MRWSLFICAALALSGCTEYRWVKPGGTVDMFNHDSYACQTDSLARMPQVLQTVYPPRERGETVCKTENGVTRCREKEGYQPPPYTVDVNKDARDQLYNACLRAGGWRLVEVKDK